MIPTFAFFTGYAFGTLTVLFAVIIFATHLHSPGQAGHTGADGASARGGTAALFPAQESTELLRDQLERCDLHLRRLTPIATHRPNRRKQ